MEALGASRSVISAARWPAELASAIISAPDVVTKGRSDPASSSPIASITRRSMLGVGLKLGEVVFEGGVDHAVASGGPVGAGCRGSSKSPR